MRTILKEFRTLSLSKTGRNTQLVFVGQFVNASIGLAFNVLLIRALNSEDYGTFILTSSTMMLISGFAHFGWIESYVKFGSQFLNTELFEKIRSLFFHLTILSALIFCSLAAVSMPWVAERIYQRGSITLYLVAASAGAFFSSFYSMTGNDYRVKQKFSKFLSLQLSLSTFRILLCLALAYFHILSLQAAILVLVLTPVFSVIFSTSERSFTSLESSEIHPQLLKEIFNYNKWIYASIFMNNVIGNIDSQFIAHYHSNTSLSLFGAASRLTLPIQFVVTALTTTLLPKLSMSRDEVSIRYYLSSLKYFLIPMTLLVLLAIVFAPPILVWIAGPQYQGISLLIRLQILTSLLVLIGNPVGLILYSWGWSRLFTILNFIQFVIDLILDWIWIPKYGALGAVLATLVIYVIGVVYNYSAVIYGLKVKAKQVA